MGQLYRESLHARVYPGNTTGSYYGGHKILATPNHATFVGTDQAVTPRRGSYGRHHRNYSYARVSKPVKWGGGAGLTASHNTSIITLGHSGLSWKTLASSSIVHARPGTDATPYHTPRPPSLPVSCFIWEEIPKPQ